MAVEAKRGCGYRKVGGLYLVSEGTGHPCCKMPIILKVCPCCGGGIKQSRGWTWIDPRPFLQGECTARPAKQFSGALAMLGASFCPAANPEALGERVGLLWIGGAFYPTPESFSKESQELGISRRISGVPRGFKVGEHWVFLAHPKVKQEKNEETGEVEWLPGIFQIFKPTRLEKIITDTMSKDEDLMNKLQAQHITPVIVPDDDKDHQGTVYDKEEEGTLL